MNDVPLPAAARSRFTPAGSSGLEAHLAQVCEQVRRGIVGVVPADELQGVLLGGGYGRGEGGVLRTPAGDRPYNDLEFYVFIHGLAVLAERRYRPPLDELAERLSPGAGLEVEFKVLTLPKLRRSPPSMFYYDLVMGHHWLIGDDGLLASCGHHRDPSRIPLHEVTRLLMNRCSGLLFAAQRLARAQFGPEDADFVGRNLAKAQLAFGDVLLAADRQYHWSCRERHLRLLYAGRPGWERMLRSPILQPVAARTGGSAPGDPDPESAIPLADLVRHHGEGVDFKFHPVCSVESREALAARHAELLRLALPLWLWLENRRLACRWTRPRDYAFTPGDLCPETSQWRNRLVNARAFGAGNVLAPGAARYPRERLLRSLALLLFEPGALETTANVEALQSWLRSSARDFPGLVAAYRRLWNRFN